MDEQHPPADAAAFIYWWNDSSLAIHTASSLPRYVIYISSFDVVAARYTKIMAWNFVNIYLKEAAAEESEQIENGAAENGFFGHAD